MADEKDEKELRKREEKSPEEKNWDEKYRRDPLGVIVWAIIFIWAGIVLLVANLGLLDAWLKANPELPPALSRLDSAWPIVLVGAGVIVLIEILIRLLMPEYRQPLFGKLIIALILLSVGLGDLINWGVVWAVLLIGAGIWVLMRGFKKQ